MTTDERLKQIAEAANLQDVTWFEDHSPTDEVLAMAAGVTVSVVAKVNPMAEWDAETAAAWCAFIATFNPARVLTLLSDKAALEAERDEWKERAQGSASRSLDPIEPRGALPTNDGGEP